MMERIKRWWTRGRAPKVPEKRRPLVTPPEADAVPTPARQKRHDGWGEIRARRPGEDTDLSLRPADITMPGKDLIPPDDDDDDD